jgi:hypothetical protein
MEVEVMNCTNFSQSKAFTWLFGSESKPNAVPHETVQWADGTTSCNCFGWTRRLRDNGTAAPCTFNDRASRECRHTRLVDEGIADDYCVSKIDHTTAQPKSKPVKLPKQIKQTEPEPEEQPKAKNIARLIKW